LTFKNEDFPHKEDIKMEMKRRAKEELEETEEGMNALTQAEGRTAPRKRARRDKEEEPKLKKGSSENKHHHYNNDNNYNNRNNDNTKNQPATRKRFGDRSNGGLPVREETVGRNLSQQWGNFKELLHKYDIICVQEDWCTEAEIARIREAAKSTHKLYSTRKSRERREKEQRRKGKKKVTKGWKDTTYTEELIRHKINLFNYILKGGVKIEGLCKEKHRNKGIC